MSTATEKADGCGPGPHAVLFDMDGLLVDTEPLWFEVERAVMARLGSDWTPADQRTLVGGSLRTSVGYLRSRAACPASEQDVAQWLVGGMARLLAERGVTAMPGALQLAGQVRQAGIPCALVTSSERVIMDAVLDVLAGCGVTFDATVCGSDVRHPKPDPEPYLRAAALLQADPASCVALEDSPNGVAAALAAGCVTIAVPGIAPIEARPALTIAGSLAEIDVAFLRGLLAESRAAP
jgi:HAD superfamily hydrolase (TIGR01509 family)